MFKKLLLTLLTLLIFLPMQNISAQETTTVATEDKIVNIYFFWGNGCPHCEKEKLFLRKIEDKYPQVKIHEYEVWNNYYNRQLMVQFGEELNVNISGAPFTVIGEHHVIGWLDENYTGKQIEEAIACSLENGCKDVGQIIVNNVKNGVEKKEVKVPSPIPETMTLPLIGEIKTKDFSLPVLTIVLGALDGFNPCAMWVLLFLISLLLGMENKKRMWILGNTFIVASASAYFLFMAAWLNLLLFIGFIIWIRLAIGAVALIGGGYNLKEYFTNPDATCKVTNTEKRKRIFNKLKEITHNQNFYLALVGIILLAFAVNIVELICSAGLPAVFTQILTLSALDKWQYYSYILLYIFIFMLDDLVVFFIAMTTLQMTGVTSKYSRLSHLIGGVLMLILGLLLIFRPEWLMFG